MHWENDGLVIWTVYDHPSDYPTCYVARKWVTPVTGPRSTATLMMACSVEMLRAVFDSWGLTCLSRFTDDDEKICETWF